MLYLACKGFFIIETTATSQASTLRIARVPIFGLLSFLFMETERTGVFRLHFIVCLYNSAQWTKPLYILL